jgi:circadian clock protein KaiA
VSIPNFSNRSKPKFNRYLGNINSGRFISPIDLANFAKIDNVIILILPRSNVNLSAPLTIAILTDSQSQARVLAGYLDGERYVCKYFADKDEFIDYVNRQQHRLDCLTIHAPELILKTIDRLSEKRILLPAVAIDSPELPDREYIYQPGEVILSQTNVSEVTTAIDSAIAKFLNLTPAERIQATSNNAADRIDIDLSKSNFLLQQQSRLADKLRERLGYLAIYYKRNSSQFFRHLDREQKQAFTLSQRDMMKSMNLSVPLFLPTYQSQKLLNYTWI